MRRDKRGFEFSFSWIFAMIVGAVILFLAIYGATKLLRTGEYQQGTETAKKLTILFDPLGVLTGDAKSGKISLNSPIKLYEDCVAAGDFGRQTFSVAEKKSFGEEFAEKGAGITSSNKYIFTRGDINGSEFYFFSKSYEMPFKVADWMIIGSENYCFVGAPTFFEEEINQLGITNVAANQSLAECKRTFPDIEKENVFCFNSGCDNKIIDLSGRGDFSSGYVEEKDGKRRYFFGSLIFPAAMSDRDNYECNVKRFMMRASKISRLYAEKSKLLSINSVCDSGIDVDLAAYSDSLAVFSQRNKTSFDALALYTQGSGINQNSQCELW